MLVLSKIDSSLVLSFILFWYFNLGNVRITGICIRDIHWGNVSGIGKCEEHWKMRGAFEELQPTPYNSV